VSKGKVLIVDNVPEAIQPRRDYLEAAGYRVLTATDPHGARRILTDGWVHLAIVDIRLVDDADRLDVSGLDLVKTTDPAIPKIILTNYPTWEATREALGPDAEGIPPAADFLCKGDGLEALLGAVERAFQTHVRLNPDLEIIFGYPPASLACLASLTEAEREIGPWLLDHTEEMADLFRRLFHDRQKVILHQMPQGRGGTTVVQVQPFSEAGEETQLVVKCGRREDIRREVARYDEFISPLTRNWSTQKLDVAETLHFGAVAYTLVGGFLEETERLTEFYRETPEPATICRIIDHLFDDTCRLWLQSKARVARQSLADQYAVRLGLHTPERQERLRQRSARLYEEGPGLGLERIECRKKELVFRFGPGRELIFPDPLDFAWHSDHPALRQPALERVSHGDLNGDNVLVDQRGHTWLIDFQHTGWGPILADFAELEGVITFELVRTRNLERLYELEKRLLAPATFDAPLPEGDDLPLDLRKAQAVIGHLRWRAGQVTGADMRQYLVGLLFHALRQVATAGGFAAGQKRPSHVRQLHAMLAAAMTAYRLQNWGDKWSGWPDEQKEAR
jgi:CheY-like chemotaxis protein